MARRFYWWLIRRLPPRYARALRSAVIFLASGGHRRAFPHRIAHTPIKFTPPRIRLLCIVWGLPESGLSAIVDRVLAVAEPAGVVVVSDSDAVHLFRKGGCRFEYVPPREDWEAHFPERDYDTFVRHRLDSLHESYTVEREAVFGDIGDGLLRSLAGAPTEAGPAGTQVARAGR